MAWQRYKLDVRSKLRCTVLVCYMPLANVTRLHTRPQVVGFALDNPTAVLTSCAQPIMVLPLHIIDAARRGNSRIVMAWLDTAPQGSVNDVGYDEEGRDPAYWGLSLLYWTCLTGRQMCISVAHVELARLLLARGADPNWRDHLSETPLHCVCYQTAGCRAAADMASLLIEAGTEFERRRTVVGENGIIYDAGVETPQFGNGELPACPSADLKVICMLLRAGASLDTLGEDFVVPGPPTPNIKGSAVTRRELPSLEISYA